MNIKEYLNDKSALVNSCLEEYFTGCCELAPDVLRESMKYSLLAGGKRLRPVLAMASYEACGGKGSDIVLGASALEVIHTYSLIHDDLPAMDDDDLRRGRPTNHKVYGEAVAILAGDGLLTEAFLMLLANEGPVKRDNIMDALKELAVAAGPAGMVGGQVMDILSENAEPDAETLDYIHRHKTGALIRASVRMGAMLAGALGEKLDLLTRYGECLGLAFQIVDDILDVKGDEKELGKPVGSDEGRNKMTYPSLYGIDSSMERAEGLIREAMSSVSTLGAEAEPLRGIADYIIRRTH
jgi:geranylgeranyl diphosphate synthase type II